jgi:hypothetical protein
MHWTEQVGWSTANFFFGAVVTVAVIMAMLAGLAFVAKTVSFTAEVALEPESCIIDPTGRHRYPACAPTILRNTSGVWFRTGNIRRPKFSMSDGDPVLLSGGDIAEGLAPSTAAPEDASFAWIVRGLRRGDRLFLDDAEVRREAYRRERRGTPTKPPKPTSVDWTDSTPVGPSDDVTMRVFGRSRAMPPDAAVGTDLYEQVVDEDNNGRWILYLHGNTGNIHFYEAIVANLVRNGYNVMVPEYRGFGIVPGTPTETSMGEDAVAAYVALLQMLGGDTSRVTVMGFSLGTFCASVVAKAFDGTPFQPKLLWLVAPFDKIKGPVMFMFPVLGLIPHLLPDEYSTIDNVRALTTTPVLVVASPSDEITGIVSAVRLYRAAQKAVGEKAGFACSAARSHHSVMCTKVVFQVVEAIFRRETQDGLDLGRVIEDRIETAQTA